MAFECRGKPFSRSPQAKQGPYRCPTRQIAGSLLICRKQESSQTLAPSPRTKKSALVKKTQITLWALFKSGDVRETFTSPTQRAGGNILGFGVPPSQRGEGSLFLPPQGDDPPVQNYTLTPWVVSASPRLVSEPEISPCSASNNFG